MRINRIYLPQALTIGQTVELPPEAVRHLVTVLKMRAGEKLVLFNGDGHQYLARIENIAKKLVQVKVLSSQAVDNESPLSLHLFQAVSRGDKMDLTIQKSVELGVNQITPLFTERCGVKLNSDRLEKKHQHWQRVIISACEQCGRNKLPVLNPAIDFGHFLKQSIDWSKTLTLNPHQGKSLSLIEKSDTFNLVIGPEGGLSDAEVEQLSEKGCIDITLGPRILRTETAGLSVISVLQNLFGDF